MIKTEKASPLPDPSEDLLEELFSILVAHLEIFKNSDLPSRSPYLALSHLIELFTNLEESDPTSDIWLEFFWSALFFLDTCKELYDLDITAELEKQSLELRRKLTEPARRHRSEASAVQKNIIVDEYLKLKAADPAITKEKAAEEISKKQGISLGIGRIRRCLYNK